MRYLLLLLTALSVGYLYVARLRPIPVWFPTVLSLPADINVSAGGNLQTALNTANCGDRIILAAGATWDTISSRPFVLPNKGCGAADPITLQSSALSQLPSGRVSPSNSANMARIRTTGGWAALSTAAGASYWVLDGLEVTDNITGSALSPYLLDFGETTAPNGPDHTTVQRCYLHPKEATGAGGTWFHYVRAAIQYEGSYLTFKWNYAAGFEGFDPGQPGVTDTWRVLLSVGGPGPILFYDNYAEAWYSAIFTGGGGGRHNHLTTSSNATLATATLASGTSMQAGLNIAVRLIDRKSVV